MPDGDKVHEGLAWKYQKFYKQICDGQFGGSELARDLVPAVWKDIQNDGDRLLLFMQKAGEQCYWIQDRRKFGNEIDWGKEFTHIDELVQPVYAKQRSKSLAANACKEEIQALRNGVDPSNCYIEILAKYMWNVYVDKFAAPSSSWNNSTYYKDVRVEFIHERLAEIRPYVEEQLLQLAEQVYRHGTVYLPRQPRRRSRTKPDYTIDTDLSTVGA